MGRLLDLGCGSVYLLITIAESICHRLRRIDAWLKLANLRSVLKTLPARGTMEMQLISILSLGVVAALRSDEVDNSLDAEATTKSCEKFLIRDGISTPGTGGFFVYSDLITNKGLFEASNTYQGDIHRAISERKVLFHT